MCVFVDLYVCVCVRLPPRLVHGNGIVAMQALLMSRVGQNHKYIYGVYTVYLAGKSPYIRSYTVYIYR
jgi:hypothetical protein